MPPLSDISLEKQSWGNVLSFFTGEAVPPSYIPGHSANISKLKVIKYFTANIWFSLGILIYRCNLY